MKMSDPNERRDAAQQETGSAQDETESKGKATRRTARQKSQEESVEAAKAEDTGAGEASTPEYVENASQQSGTTARSKQAIVGHLAVPCIPPDPAQPCPPCSGPDHAGILEQYAVLKVTLAGPNERDIDLTKEIVVDVDDNGNPTDEDTIIDKTSGQVIDFPVNPCNFFAPSPLGRAPALSRPGAPVFWLLPAPQPLGQPSCLTPCQGCICEDCFQSTGEGCFGDSSDRVQSVSQSPLAPFHGVNTSE
jgi:hypothetical protein